MNEESDFKKITIIGCGLIGGSIGLALKKYHYAGQIFGIDRQEIIAKAIRLGAINQGSEEIERGLKNADMVILATPVKEIINLINRIKPFLSRHCLVTDTGSTKTDIVKEAENVFLNDFDFIGGHPMAGLEKGGIDYAHPDLFAGKPYIIIPMAGNSNLASLKMSSLINRIGAIEINMDASEHDRIVALVSHLPQLIAVIMANMLGLLAREKNDEQYFKISGNVFHEMTRIASSPFAIWKDIYQTNGEYTMDFIDELENWLEKMKQKIAQDPAGLEEDFKNARYYKEQMLKMMD